MSADDIRWELRFANYKKALLQLSEGVSLANERELSTLEKLGLIKYFEYTHELAWKTMQDFLKSRGTDGIYGSKDATREAFRLELIQDGDGWMKMIKSRNLSSHTYNQDTAEEIVRDVIELYVDLFAQFQGEMNGIVFYKQSDK
jgi:nucleotidyltransferase substrate binding protein (TIGR01987 family)